MTQVMKKNQKITKVRLDLKNENEFLILGIVSAEPDYKVSLSINKKLGLSLRNITPIALSGDSGHEVAFSRFSDAAGSPGLVYFLLANRSGNNFLIKKLKNIDYIFLVHDMESTDSDWVRSISVITSSLKESEFLNAVFQIDISVLGEKTLHHLLI
jgi:uncharacterized protein with ACT and thioredoxin-like domain